MDETSKSNKVLSTVDSMKDRRPTTNICKSTEEKCLIAIRPNGKNAVVIVEKTSGPLTQEIYQTPTHVHGILVSRTSLKSLFQLEQCESISFPLLTKKLKQDELQLIDLLDALDKAGVKYSYFSEYGTDIILRPSKQ